MISLFRGGGVWGFQGGMPKYRRPEGDPGHHHMFRTGQTYINRSGDVICLPGFRNQHLDLLACRGRIGAGEA